MLIARNQCSIFLLSAFILNMWELEGYNNIRHSTIMKRPNFSSFEKGGKFVGLFLWERGTNKLVAKYIKGGSMS